MRRRGQKPEANDEDGEEEEAVDTQEETESMEVESVNNMDIGTLRERPDTEILRFNRNK